jgi:hypothetical protein
VRCLPLQKNSALTGLLAQVKLVPENTRARQTREGEHYRGKEDAKEVENYVAVEAVRSENRKEPSICRVHILGCRYKLSGTRLLE